MGLTVVQWVPTRIIEKVSIVDDHWIWTGATKGRKPESQYGVVWNGSKLERAPRFFYSRFRGPIPDGMTVDHLCKVTRCVNPSHLELVTLRENVLRARPSGPDTCPHGHPLDRERVNRGRVIRYCSICHNADYRRWYRRQKGGTTAWD